MWIGLRSTSLLPRTPGGLQRRGVMVAALLALSSIASSAVPAPDPAPSASVAVAPEGFKTDAVERAIDKLASEAKGWGGSVGVAIVDVGTGKTISGRNEHTAKNPASNAKIFTAFSALKLL